MQAGYNRAVFFDDKKKHCEESLGSFGKNAG